MDSLKGYAIFLVVYGHVVQCFNEDWQYDRIELAIIMFHMPLFMIISGYFAFGTFEGYSFKDNLRKRFIQLMVPSLTMGAINACLVGGGKILQSKPLETLYFLNLILTGMWYLTTLFLLYSVGILLHHTIGNKFFYTGWILFYLFVYFMPDIWVANSIEYLVPFFLLGMMSRKHEWSWNKLPLWIVCPCICIFIIVGLKFDFSCSMYEMSEYIYSMEYIYKSLIRLLGGLSGIVMSMFVVRYLIQWTNTRVIQVVAKVGMMTLPIYILHQKFLMFNRLSVLRLDNNILFVLITVSLMFVCVWTYRRLKCYKILALLLFGEKIN